MNTAVVLSDSLGGILTLVAFMGILGVYFVSKRLRRREVFWNWMGTLLVLSGLLGTLFLLGYSEKMPVQRTTLGLGKRGLLLSVSVFGRERIDC